MTKKTSTMEDLGWDEHSRRCLATEIARHAGYQLAGQEHGVPWRQLAEHETVEKLLGVERWMRLGKFTFEAIGGLTVSGELDAEGPVIRIAELNRLGALVLAQFLAQDPAAGCS